MSYDSDEGGCQGERQRVFLLLEHHNEFLHHVGGSEAYDVECGVLVGGDQLGQGLEEDLLYLEGSFLPYPPIEYQVDECGKIGYHPVSIGGSQFQHCRLCLFGGDHLAHSLNEARMLFLRKQKKN